MTQSAKIKLGDILKSTGKLSQEQLEHALLAQKESGDKIGEALVRHGVLSSQDVQRALAHQYGLEVFDNLTSFSFPQCLYDQLPYAFVKKHQVLPVEESSHILIVAVSDPFNMQALDELWLIFRKEIKAIFCPELVLIEAMNECYHQGDHAASQLIADLTDDVNFLPKDRYVAAYDLLDDSNQAPIIKLMNFIITEAIQQGASDIHIDPSADHLTVRYRIDGVLLKRHTPPKEYQAQLTTRIKVMAQLDIAERRMPQDGRIKLNLGGRDIDFRVSTLPVVYGERIVLRILDRGNVILGLEHLGMREETLKYFSRFISYPEGIVLVTGPTGSGKTTTLYSAVSEKKSDALNIMTIEDPVEYNLPGIAQTGVQPKIGLDFATGLRHILRQDPDVIMIGEIRDHETAEIAVQAALTGHLVLSTLHTNDAPSAITRLVDMGIEPFLLSSSVIAVLAQRLVRKICVHCTFSQQTPEQEWLECLHDYEMPQNVFQGRGCEHCFGTGYRGRLGIYELLSIDSAIKSQIVASADAMQLRQLALKRGMQTLRCHGYQLIYEGKTTIAEVLRLTRAIEQSG